jgi:glycolate oxidase iron-sulfur subunit
VEYGKLVDIGREIVEERVGRPAGERLKRWFLSHTLPYPALFGFALGLGRTFRRLLPSSLARKIPARRPAGDWPAARHARRMLVLAGCVQPSMAPSINAAAARVLDRLGISLVEAAGAGCCGGVTFHLNYQEDSLAFMRANIDAWWPHVEKGAEAVVITASGCGITVAEYGRHLAHDAAYAAKAARISELAKDIADVVAAERKGLAALARNAGTKVAFHSPCSLQHGLKVRGVVESIMADAGFVLTPIPDAHLCCGSAGTYSITQPALSKELLANKVRALESGQPAIVATANIGCQAHIASATDVPVRHWIELMDEALGA